MVSMARDVMFEYPFYEVYPSYETYPFYGMYPDKG